MQNVQAAVVGGGQAGVSLAHYLNKRGIEPLVFERDRAFSSWRNRWDGFRVNTPNWMNSLRVSESPVAPTWEPDGFATREAVVAYLETVLSGVPVPVKEGTEVTRVVRLTDGTWLLEANGTQYCALTLALCNGAMSVPRLPATAADLPDDLAQLHSSQYRNPEQIGTSSVLVVGSASSGVQIARLLAESGRFAKVHLAVSKVLVLPRKIMGIPTHRVIHRLGLFDVRTNSALGRLMYSGLETRGDPIMRPTPKDLEKDYGVRLHDRFAGCTGRTISFASGTGLSCDDLTVVWCTGFRPDYGFLKLENRDAAFLPSEHPIHLRGVSAAEPGLFFVGLRYQHTVASHDIYGVGQDAEFIAGSIHRYLESRDEHR